MEYTDRPAFSDARKHTGKPEPTIIPPNLPTPWAAVSDRCPHGWGASPGDWGDNGQTGGYPSESGPVTRAGWTRKASIPKQRVTPRRALNWHRARTHHSRNWIERRGTPKVGIAVAPATKTTRSFWSGRPGRLPPALNLGDSRPPARGADHVSAIAVCGLGHPEPCGGPGFGVRLDVGVTPIRRIAPGLGAPVALPVADGDGRPASQGGEGRPPLCVDPPGALRHETQATGMR